MKVLFVINPTSGQKATNLVEQMIVAEARLRDFEFMIYTMQQGIDIDEKKRIAKKITEYHPDIVAAVGGDGTVNLMADILSHKHYPLLIIPAGSANGMAKELGIYKIESALHLLSRGYEKRIDLIRINGITCIHLADVGVNARVVKRFQNNKTRGIWAYARHLWSEIFLIPHYWFYIRYNGTRIARKAVSLTIANASKYGTGAIINPVGRVDDGQFELVVIKPFPRIKILSIAWHMFTGNLKDSEYVEVLSCENAHIMCSRRTTLQIDGEIIGKLDELDIEIKREALNVIVPSPDIY